MLERQRACDVQCSITPQECNYAAFVNFAREVFGICRASCSLHSLTTLQYIIILALNICVSRPLCCRHITGAFHDVNL